MYALQVEQLSKVYSNQFEALKNISLSVKKGDFFALLGSNGAGKSTTIGIIASLLNKTSGSVQVFDYDLDTQREQAKAQIGLVPQEFNFNVFESVEEIVCNQGGYYGLPIKERHLRCDQLLKSLQLWDKRKQQSRTLSGGMKRRLMIARALIHQPRLLILDEPTAGVDVEIRRSMWAFLRELNRQGTTIILTTHYLEEAENLCKNIAIIDQGQVLQQTSMKALLRQLDHETFIFDLEQDLEEAPMIEQCHIEWVETNTLEISFSPETLSLNEIFQALNGLGIRVKSMRNKTNRLEQLFFDLVGDKTDYAKGVQQ